MMYSHIDAPYYDDAMDVEPDAYYDQQEDPYRQATGAYRWVRPGYVPPGEKKTELEERREEIQQLKQEIEEKERRLKLMMLDKQIKDMQKSLQQKEELARQRHATQQQAEIQEKLTQKHEQERKTKIQSSFKQAFNVPVDEKETVISGVASVDDIQRILNCHSDYECFQHHGSWGSNCVARDLDHHEAPLKPSSKLNKNLSQPTMLSTIKKKYKELAKMLHPDKCKLKGSKEAFIKIGEAYERLTQLYPTSDIQ